jgi:ArsR family transcriptional regulator
MVQECKERIGDCNLNELIDLSIFKALADPMRVSLFCRVATLGCCTVSEAAACCPIDISVVSRHLSGLKGVGLLTAEKRGREVYYRFAARELAQSLRAIADVLEHWDAKHQGGTR